MGFDPVDGTLVEVGVGCEESALLAHVGRLAEGFTEMACRREVQRRRASAASMTRLRQAGEKDRSDSSGG